MNEHKGDEGVMLEPETKDAPKPQPSQGPLKNEPTPERAREEKERMNEQATRKG